MTLQESGIARQRPEEPLPGSHNPVWLVEDCSTDCMHDGYEKMLKIRRARIEDLDSITEIYNDAILKTAAAFDTEAKTIEEQKLWFKNHGPKYPILVAELGNIVVGWASLSQWSDRCAYSDTAEISLYVAEEHREKGIGKKLLEAIVQEGEKRVYTRSSHESLRAMIRAFIFMNPLALNTSVL